LTWRAKSLARALPMKIWEIWPTTQGMMSRPCWEMSEDR
jgi:hypothetical protein